MEMSSRLSLWLLVSPTSVALRGRCRWVVASWVPSSRLVQGASLGAAASAGALAGAAKRLPSSFGPFDRVELFELFERREAGVRSLLEPGAAVCVGSYIR